MTAVLDELVLADDPQTWRELGFAVDDDAALIGGVTIRLAGTGVGEGIVGWSVRGLADGDLDGLPVPRATPSPPAVEAPPVADEHPNGVVAVDHVVALTGDLGRTMAALRAGGLEPRRVREVPDGPLRQAFYVLGTALLELAGPIEGRDRAALWGLTLVVSDIDALADRLGDRVGTIRDAVQPGRRIVTLRREGGSSTAIAFMTPR